MNARTAPSGGAWATSGAATDFTFIDNNAFLSEGIQRATASDTGYRFAILGSTNTTDTEVGTAIWLLNGIFPDVIDMAVVARWTDANNHLRLRFVYNAVPSKGQLVIEQVVAGVATTLNSSPAFDFSSPSGAPTLRLVVYSSGQAIGLLLDGSGNIGASVKASSAALATGGTLASGKPGLADRHTGSSSDWARQYDNFYVATPAAEPIALYAGRTLDVRSDDCIRQDSTGTYYGRVPLYRGSRLFVPCSGDKGRTTRIIVKADRNDLEAAADTPLGDSLTAQVFITPRYLAVPR